MYHTVTRSPYYSHDVLSFTWRLCTNSRLDPVLVDSLEAIFNNENLWIHKHHTDPVCMYR